MSGHLNAIVFVLLLIMEVNRDFCMTSPVMETTTATTRRSITNRYGLVIAVPVKATREKTANNNTLDCTQLFEAYTDKSATDANENIKDILEDTPVVTDVKFKDLKIYGLNPFDLYCSPLQFKDLPAELIIIFPGGPHLNCSDSDESNFCDIIVAKPARIGVRISRARGTSPLCATLFTAQVKIPSWEVLHEQGTLLIENIHPVSHTCQRTAFTELIQGSKSVEEQEPLPELKHSVVKRSADGERSIRDAALEGVRKREPLATTTSTTTENPLKSVISTVAVSTTKLLSWPTSPCDWFVVTMHFIAVALVILHLWKLYRFRNRATSRFPYDILIIRGATEPSIVWEEEVTTRIV